MLEIRSTNAACLISTETGIIADITDSGDGYNFYKFERTDEIMDSFIRYREAVSKREELMVNLVDYNYYFNYYLNATKSYKY